MKKIISLIIGIFLLIPINQAQIKKIKVKFVDLGIETPIRIDKNEFESYFFKEMDSTFVISHRKINELRKLIFRLKSADMNLYSQPDVRIKIIMFGSNRISDTICVGQFVAEKGNHFFIASPSFMKIIKKTCKK